MKKILIGGAALVSLGSDRRTEDTDFLIFDSTNKNEFIHDPAGNIDYINAAANKFFAEIWDLERNNNTGVASPQALLELKAYAFIQHCLNGFWGKANAAEYDIKFLVLTFNLLGVNILKKYATKGEIFEIDKVIKSAKRL